MIKALLNEEGKKVWGYVFPDNAVPVRNIASQEAQIVGLGQEKVYLVDWAALTDEQRNLILRHLASRFGNSVDEVEKEILKTGLPLRAKYVSCTSIPSRFLI